MELKKRVVSGFMWHSAERFGTTAFQTAISLLLARMLAPSDFGLVSMLVVFSAIAQSIVDSGFSQALIRKEKPTPTDYTSVFYVNLALSVIIYLLLLALSHPISRFYGVVELTLIAPYVFAIIPINALGLIQGTVIFKEMRFRLSAKINLLAALVSGLIALVLAYKGFGVWTIVWQMVSRDALRVVLMWVWNRWFPRGRFSWAAVGELFGFGSKLLLSGIVNQISHNVAQLFIGKVYNPTQLGLYYQSQKLKDTFSLTLAQSIMNVSFPAFAELQNDRDKLREASRKVILVLSFLLFPVLTGLIAVSEDFFRLVLTEKWMPAVPYFQVFCLSAFFTPASYVSYNVLRARGRGNLILNLEFFKKGFMLAAIIVAAQFSVLAIVWSVVVYTLWDTLLNTHYAKKETGYTPGRLLWDSLPYLLLSGAMYVCLWVLSFALPFIADGWLLVIKIVVGAVVYAGLAKLSNPLAWRETIAIIKSRKQPK